MPKAVVALIAFATGISPLASGGTTLTGGPYSLDKAGFASGGASLQGGPYELAGTFARPEAQTAATGGGFHLSGGLRTQSTTPTTPGRIFANGFE